MRTELRAGAFSESPGLGGPWLEERERETAA